MESNPKSIKYFILSLDKPMKDHTLMQTIARANRVTDFTINGKPKKNGLVVDYYNVFRNLKKAFASYGGGSIGGGEGNDENSPAREIEQLFALLRDAITECNEFCKSIQIDLDKIRRSGEVFSKLSLFEEFADMLMANEAHKMQFMVYDNTIDALYEACKPEIVGRRSEFPLAAIIRYLRQVMDGKADRGNLDSAKRRISQLLDESIIAQEEEASGRKRKDTESGTDEPELYIKSWKQLDLSKLDVEKLKEEFRQAIYKHIEIADLQAFIQDKLHMMMSRNVTRRSFAEKLHEIIDRYNSGNSSNENYFEDLIAFLDKMKEEEMRAAREGLTEEELEIFDMLKKEKLTREEEQKVKLAARNLLHRLKDERPKVLINDWHKDTQTKLQVQAVIKELLNKDLPDTYDRALYATKCDAVFEHFYIMAASGDHRAFVA